MNFKKKIATVVAIATVFTSSITGTALSVSAATVNPPAFNFTYANNRAMYYDFNGDHTLTLRDAVVGNNYVKQGKLTNNDVNVLRQRIAGGYQDTLTIENEIVVADTSSLLGKIMDEYMNKMLFVDASVSGKSLKLRFLKDSVLYDVRFDDYSPGWYKGASKTYDFSMGNYNVSIGIKGGKTVWAYKFSGKDSYLMESGSKNSAMTSIIDSFQVGPFTVNKENGYVTVIRESDGKQLCFRNYSVVDLAGFPDNIPNRITDIGVIHDSVGTGMWAIGATSDSYKLYSVE